MLSGPMNIHHTIDFPVKYGGFPVDFPSNQFIYSVLFLMPNDRFPAVFGQHHEVCSCGGAFVLRQGWRFFCGGAKQGSGLM